ncbi:MAG: hypothetical protein IJL39_00590, partial [Clostridia bacterium]|nr:hypothetical protein [Clostridia bacterium]
SVLFCVKQTACGIYKMGKEQGSATLSGLVSDRGLRETGMLGILWKSEVLQYEIPTRGRADLRSE